MGEEIFTCSEWAAAGRALVVPLLLLDGGHFVGNELSLLKNENVEELTRRRRRRSRPTESNGFRLTQKSVGAEFWRKARRS